MEGGRLWDGYHGRRGFGSSDRTGKWIFRMAPEDACRAMETLYLAIESGKVAAAKRSGPAIEESLGCALVLAYSEANDPEGASRTLGTLRGIGLRGAAEFKDDQATYRGNDEIAYRDVDLETGGALTCDGVLPEGAVVRLDDGSYVEAWRTGFDPEGGPRGVGRRLQAASRGGLLDEDLWLDPEIRVGRRLNLVRIDFPRVVHVIGADWGPSCPRGMCG